MLKFAITGISIIFLSSCSSMPDMPWSESQVDGPSCQTGDKDYEAGTIIVEDGTLRRCMQTDVDSPYTWVVYHPEQ